MREIKLPKWDGTENCAGMDVNAFFDDNRKTRWQETTERRELIELCMTCNKLAECAEYSLKHELYGFWAGMTQDERVEYRKKNKIKLVRPELYSDYLPDFRKGVPNDNLNNG